MTSDEQRGELEDAATGIPAEKEEPDPAGAVDEPEVSDVDGPPEGEEQDPAQNDPPLAGYQARDPQTEMPVVPSAPESVTDSGEVDPPDDKEPRVPE